MARHSWLKNLLFVRPGDNPADAATLAPKLDHFLYDGIEKRGELRKVEPF